MYACGSRAHACRYSVFAWWCRALNGSCCALAWCTSSLGSRVRWRVGQVSRCSGATRRRSMEVVRFTAAMARSSGVARVVVEQRLPIVDSRGALGESLLLCSGSSLLRFGSSLPRVGAGWQGDGAAMRWAAVSWRSGKSLRRFFGSARPLIRASRECVGSARRSFGAPGGCCGAPVLLVGCAVRRCDLLRASLYPIHRLDTVSSIGP